MPSSIPASRTIEITLAPPAARGRTPLQEAWGRLIANPVARGGLVVVVLLALMAVLTPVLHLYRPEVDSDLLIRLQPPTWEHPFGTDTLGRDILVRVLHGARVSLGLGLGSVAVAAVAGTLLGLLAGYAGRWVDLSLMFCMDILLAFPATLLAI
ncbi:MAG: ABC transporter permease, partial [Candidatus Methylomirabilales bacterium]